MRISRTESIIGVRPQMYMSVAGSIWSDFNGSVTRPRVPCQFSEGWESVVMKVKLGWLVARFSKWSR